MPDFLVLFNHTLTDDQGLDARDLLGVDEFVFPPLSISALWHAIPPGINELHPVLTPVFRWLDDTGKAGDYLLVQGDFGATCMVVEYARGAGLVPVYAATERRACEQRREDGTVETVHEFRHVRFREYGK